MRLTLMPTRLVAVGSCDTAMIAVPVRVRLKNSAAADGEHGQHDDDEHAAAW